MKIIINGLGGQHDLNVSSSFIQGYESVGGSWTGSIEMRVDSLSSSLSYAKNNNYSIVIRSTTGMENYIALASSSYPDVLTVMPAGSNSYILIYTGSIPQNILITGAGDINNETGYHIEFFSPDPIQIEPEASSYSNGYIAGQIAYIMDQLSCTSWEARYRAQQTATLGTSGSAYDGYGLININEAINFTGSIIDDPFYPMIHESGSDYPLSGLQMKYLTPLNISNSLDVVGTIRVGLAQQNSVNNIHQITGSIFAKTEALRLDSTNSTGPALFLYNTSNDYFLENAGITMISYPTSSNQFYISNFGQNALSGTSEWSGNTVFNRLNGKIIFGNLNYQNSILTVDIDNSIVEVSGTINIYGSITASSANITTLNTLDGKITASDANITNLTVNSFTATSFTASSVIEFTGSTNIILTASVGSDQPYLEMTNYAGPSSTGPTVLIQRANGIDGYLPNQYLIGSLKFNQPLTLLPSLFYTTAKITSTVVSSSNAYGSDLRFYTSYDSTPFAVQRMLIDAAGNVGIGTFPLGVKPSALLHISGTINIGSTTSNLHKITGSIEMNANSFTIVGGTSQAIIKAKAYSSNADSGHGINISRFRGTITSPESLLELDTLGYIYFKQPLPSSTTIDVPSSLISSYATSGSGLMGSDLRFATSYDVENIGPIEQMTISSGGLVTINEDLNVGGLINGVKEYVAFFQQIGTNSPSSITTLKNTLGSAVSWSYQGVGIYALTSTGSWTLGKTIAFVDYQFLNQPSTTEIKTLQIWRSAANNNLYIEQKRLISGSTVPEFVDGIQYGIIKIEVYS